METERDIFGTPIERKWRTHRMGRQPIDLPTHELLRMATPERALYAEQLRRTAIQRANRIMRSGEYSYSLDRMLTLFGESVGDYGAAGLHSRDKRKQHGREYTLFSPVIEKGDRGYTKLSDSFMKYRDPHNALSSYITVLQDFLGSQTSTITGIRKMNQNWDRAIFGTMRRGRAITARHRMTAAERKQFWDVYRELKMVYGEIKPTFFTSTDENGMMKIWGRDPDAFKNLSFDELYKLLSDRIEGRSEFDRVPEADFFALGGGSADSDTGDGIADNLS